MSNRPALLASGLCWLSLAVAGCSSGPPTPRMRLGSIPFPGPFTLYCVCNPDDLGGHRFESWMDRHDGPSECGRGILYTRRAGFLDLSHVRESIDIVKYAHDRITELLASGKGGVFSMDWAGTRHDVVVRIPDWWESTPERDRVEIARECAIRQAQRFAVIVGAFHELGTWYGMMLIPPIPEKNSAFTWDDAASHVVAASVAGKALRQHDPSWNAAVARVLHQELADLGVVNIDCEAQAVERAHGRWWWWGAAIRRDLDVGLAGNLKMPWLVPGLECCATDSNPGLPLADLGVVAGRDLRDICQVQIIPDHWLMRRALGCAYCPEAITTEQELLEAIERLRGEVKAEYGPEADQP